MQLEIITMIADVERDESIVAAKCPQCGAYVRPTNGNLIAWKFGALRAHLHYPSATTLCGGCNKEITL